MKYFLYAIFIIAVQAINTLAIAQKIAINDVKNSDSELNLKLAEIQQERQSIESDFKSREVVCYSKFAVSNCLQELKSEKLLLLSDIKRRELAINDQKRRIKSDTVTKKAFEKSKKIAEKELVKEQIPTPTLPSESNGGKATKISKTKKTVTEAEAPAENDKSKLVEQRAIAAKQRVLEANIKLAASQQKAQSRAKKLNQASAQEAKFNQKLLDAQKRQSIIDKKIAEKAKQKTIPLSIPSQTQIKP